MGSFSTADPNAFVALGMQTGLGSPQTAVAKSRFLKYTSGIQVQVQADVTDLREGGDGLDFGSTYKKLQRVTGQLVFNARPEPLGILLQCVPANATWDGASAPANHTFSTQSATWPYATIQIAYPGTSFFNLMSDVKFTGLTLEGQHGEPIKVTAPFTAITYGGSGAVFVPSFNNDPYFLYQNAPSYVLNGTGDSTIDSWKVDLKFGVDELQAQSIILDDIALMNRDLDVQVTRRFQDPTFWKTVYYGGGVTPTTSVATGSLDLLNVLGANSIRVRVPLVSWRQDSLTDPDPDGKTVYETIAGKGLKGATAAMIVNIANSHASAYAP